VDFTSLYPTIQFYKEYPVGHHEVIYPSQGQTDIKPYWGLIKCDVIPPRGLLHPVLPKKIAGKLMFTLCNACAEIANPQCKRCTHTDKERTLSGTWHSVEVAKAVEKGYTITNLKEVWHWKERTTNLFKPYVSHFLKLKQEASGFPEGCTTDDQKQKYVDDYKKDMSIQLDIDKIARNNGARAVAKLCLNSLWGKFGQSMDKPQTTYINNERELFKLLGDVNISEIDLNIINNEVIQANYSMKKETMQDPLNTNIMIALTTTAHARLELYNLLDFLGDRVLYYDTDSVIYKHSDDPTQNPKLGDNLGDLTDELDGKFITTHVSGGPKNYGNIQSDNSSNMKLKGFSLHHENSNCLNITNTYTVIATALGIKNDSAMEKLENILNDEQKTIHKRVKRNRGNKITVWNERQITRSKKDVSMKSKYLEKQYGFTYTKRCIAEINNYEITTRPYGY
jgi:hypothetical protein